MTALVGLALESDVGRQGLGVAVLLLTLGAVGAVWVAVLAARERAERLSNTRRRAAHLPSHRAARRHEVVRRG